jgi:hypothetical protein
LNHQQALTLINAYVEGWKNNRPDQIVGTLAPDCLVIESHGPTYRGRDHVLLWVTDWFQQGQSIQRWELSSFVYEDDAAAFEWVFECSGGWGRAVFDGMTVVRFTDGLISSLREYRCTTPPYVWSPERREGAG